jgi:hypothetical protein
MLTVLFNLFAALVAITCLLLPCVATKAHFLQGNTSPMLLAVLRKEHAQKRTAHNTSVLAYGRACLQAKLALRYAPMRYRPLTRHAINRQANTVAIAAQYGLGTDQVLTALEKRTQAKLAMIEAKLELEGYYDSSNLTLS